MRSNTTILSSFSAAFTNSYEALPPKGPVTIHQKSLLLWWMTLTVLWVYRKFVSQILRRKQHEDADEEHLIESNVNNSKKVIVAGNEKRDVHHNHVTCDDALFSVFSVGSIMLYYFFCDYLHYFAKAERTYNRDLFIFLCLLLVVVAVFFTSKEITGAGKLLNREQTEEWKGWMQVMFVWYHYFKALETYNAVRIYIAAYVFMTGFGNFSFFWVKKDYSLRRVMKMLFRLNFLVVTTVFVVDNQYMLYYICAMHTFWFLSVYAMMRPFNQYNEMKEVMMAKLLLYLIVILSIFNIPILTNTIFSPLSFILNYDNSMHEWIFRCKLDHCVTFVGMLCAYNHPTAKKYLNYLNGHRFEKLILGCISTLLLVICGLWYKYVFILEKYEYNKLHPYTSFIPILTFILLRNSTSWLRRRYLFLFVFLGKITLETYISQLHIYLQSNAKNLIVYVSGYPLVNFVINTFIYLYMSRVLFHATLTLNEYIFPNDARKMWKNVVLIMVSIALSYALVFFSSLTS